VCTSFQPARPYTPPCYFLEGKLSRGPRWRRALDAHNSPRAVADARALPRRLGQPTGRHGRSSIFAHVSRATTAHQGTSYWIAAPTISPCRYLLLATIHPRLLLVLLAAPSRFSRSGVIWVNRGYRHAWLCATLAGSKGSSRIAISRPVSSIVSSLSESRKHDSGYRGVSRLPRSFRASREPSRCSQARARTVALPRARFL